MRVERCTGERLTIKMRLQRGRGKLQKRMDGKHAKQKEDEQKRKVGNKR